MRPDFMYTIYHDQFRMLTSTTEALPDDISSGIGTKLMDNTVYEYGSL